MLGMLTSMQLVMLFDRTEWKQVALFLLDVATKEFYQETTKAVWR